MFAKVSSSELSLFFQRLSAMIEAGVTLHEALFFLEKGETNPKLRLALEGLHLRLSRGFPMSRGMTDFSDIFSRLSIELISVGENTGMLVPALRRISDLSQRVMERRRMVWSALAYPLCLGLVMLVVTALFVVFVGPGENGLFSALGDDIPWPSQVLISISSVFSNTTLMVVLFTLACLATLLVRRYVAADPRVRQVVHKVYLSVPVVGPLVAKSELARTLDVIASSQTVGAPLLSSLVNCQSVALNLEHRSRLEELSQAIKQGEAFGRSFAAIPYVPRYVGALLEVTDETGNLEQVARHLADAVEEDLLADLNTAVKLLEPCLLLVSGLAAGFVTIATFLPVVRLVTNL